MEVSRSTLLQAYDILIERNIIRVESRSKLVLRRPVEPDYFDDVSEVDSKTQQVENFILEKFSKNELKPGDRFSELQIAKELGANTITVREVLLKISGTGLIGKSPRKKWEVIDLTPETMTQVTNYRQLLEMNGLRAMFQGGSLKQSAKKLFERVSDQHQRVDQKAEIGREEIINMEAVFHKGIVSFTGNRFMQQSYDSLFIVSRYHLGQQIMTQQRMHDVLVEHLAVMKAILADDYEKAVSELESHFDKAKDFFIHSTRETLQALTDKSVN
jgi:GntR family transcriptional regulator, transcriptional activator for L-galactonate catabolism